MYEDRQFHPWAVGRCKSWAVILISIPAALATGIASVTIPLYLYSIFKSEAVVGQIMSLQAIATLLVTVCLGILLARFTRFALYNISNAVGIVSIILFVAAQGFLNILVAQTLFVSFQIIFWGTLFLSLRDVTPDKKLKFYTGLEAALNNIAIVGSPIFTGWLIHYIEQNTASIMKFGAATIFLSKEYAHYEIPLLLIPVLLLLTSALTLWFKFILGHDYLQDSPDNHPKKYAQYHPRHMAINNMVRFFQNDNRTLAFLNYLFRTIWHIFTAIFFVLLLTQHGVSLQTIGLIIGLMKLPNVIVDLVFSWLVSKAKSTLNLLLIGYGILCFFLTIASVVGLANIYLYASILFVSQIGMAISEPLTSLQYYQGTTKENEGTFYNIFCLGKSLPYLIAPVVIGLSIKYVGIDTVFKTLPLVFILFSLFLLRFKLKEKRQVAEKNRA